MLEGDPVLNEGGVYVQNASDCQDERSVMSAPSAIHGGHNKKYTRSYGSQQAQDTYALPITVARSVQRPTHSQALGREELTYAWPQSYLGSRRDTRQRLV